MRRWVPNDIDVVRLLAQDPYLPIYKIVPVGDVYAASRSWYLRVLERRAGQQVVRWERISQKRAQKLLDEAVLRDSYGMEVEL